MYEVISKDDFIDRFVALSPDNFSHEGLCALFDYLEELEYDLGSQELDVIALCCEYSEYKNVEEYLQNYNSAIEREDYADENNIIDVVAFEDAVKKEIQDKTTFIDIDGVSFIIRDY